MKHLVWALTAAALMLTANGIDAPSSSLAQDAGLVHMSSDVTYDARLDSGPITVTWDVTLQNNDPGTTFNSSGVSYFYARWAVPVLRGASVSATGPSGSPLAVSIIDNDVGPIVAAQVTFDTSLFYGSSYTFSVSYSLAEIRTESLLITPFYAYIPAFGAGDASTVRVLTPNSPTWESDVQPVECEARGDDVFDCSTSSDLLLAAFVEVSRPSSLLTETGTARLDRQAVSLSVRYFPGEDAWASHVLEVSEASLPVLEDLFGRPYDLETSIEITERGQVDLLGYEGLFICVTSPCSIGVSPIADDLTLLHELAHAWTENTQERWLAEGLAELMARKAANQLGPLVSYSQREAPIRIQVFPLDEWERSLLSVEASDEERERELSGYERSLRFLQLIERRFGLAAIQRAGDPVGFADIDTRDFFDALEEETGANLDALFLEWVFPASFRSTLEERREVRNLYKLVDELAKQAGLELTPKIQEQVGNWRFDLASDELNEANEALTAYSQAKTDVDASRNPLQRIGLAGSDPDAVLEEAASAFNVGNHSETLDRSEEARDMVDGAATTGLLRLLIALALPLALLAIVLVAVLRRRAATRENSAGTAI